MQNSKRRKKSQTRSPWKPSEKPISKHLAWLDLVRLARHKKTDWYAKSWTIPLERGWFYCKKSNLAKRWGWTDKKVRRFFNALEKEGKILQGPLPGVGTLATILDLDNAIKEFFGDL